MNATLEVVVSQTPLDDSISGPYSVPHLQRGKSHADEMRRELAYRRVLRAAQQETGHHFGGRHRAKDQRQQRFALRYLADTDTSYAAKLLGMPVGAFVLTSIAFSELDRVRAWQYYQL